MLQQAFRETVLGWSKTFEWKKARQVRSNVKTMLITFFDVEGLVHHEFLPQHQTMNQTVYITVLQHLRDAVCWKRLHKWSSDTWLLHYNSVPCHAALSVREFLAKHSIPVVPYLPYSPDLAPCNFFLFPRLKSTLKGKQFQDVTEIELNMTRQLQAIPKQAYQTCIESGRIAGIATYNLEGRTLNEITSSNL
jgi:histone-lysine N-methyltransferase SETMAR